MVAVTQIGHWHSEGRACYDKKLAEGKTPKEALRSLKRQISNAIFACLQADARRAAASAKSPGGQQGTTLSPARPDCTPGTGSSDKPLPGPATTLRLRPATRRPALPVPGQSWPFLDRRHHAAGAAEGPGGAPQRSEDERPGGAARRRPHSAARKARNR